MANDAIRISKVSISDLFGSFNHSFELDAESRVTILHGQNGIGKTALLKLLFSIFSGKLFDIFRINFSTLQIDFHNGEFICIKRQPSVAESGAEKITLIRRTLLGLETKEDFHLDRKSLNKYATGVARRLPWLERIESDLWIDRRSRETITSVEILARYENEQDPRVAASLGEQVKPIVSVQEQIKEIAARVNVHIIETQRLLKRPKNVERKPYGEPDGDSEVRTSVNECASEIKARLHQVLTKYATDSQKRDETFPLRLLAPGPYSAVDKETLKICLEEINNKRKQLADVGLLIDRENNARGFEALDLDNADEAQLRVIQLYAGDTIGKLATLDELLKISLLFFGVVNERFRRKHLMLDKERGLVASADNSVFIPLDSLSSGEQHQLVLFYDLLFKANDGSLVLIDEPELSLHVTWQKNLLDSLIAVAQQKNLDILIATHSPYIVGSRVNLMRELNDH